MTPSPQTCTICGTHFEGLQRKVGVNVFCSPACSNVGKRAYLRNVRTAPFAPFEPSPLNLAVTAAYEWCKANGTHRAGLRETGWRNVGGADAQLPICDVCEVPIPGRGMTFSINGQPGRAA